MSKPSLLGREKTALDGMREKEVETGIEERERERERERESSQTKVNLLPHTHRFQDFASATHQKRALQWSLQQ